MAEQTFQLVSNYQPTGDQPQAIAQLVEGVERGDRCQTLLGVTGTRQDLYHGQRHCQDATAPRWCWPTTRRWRPSCAPSSSAFFPDNAVEYFVSYYDYYQPEAYIPSTDTYIEKDSAINDEIDRLRHSATAALSERRDVIIVASVSCIYSLGDPIDYRSMVISLRPGMEHGAGRALPSGWSTLQYERNDINFIRNKFRVHGDTVDIYLAYMSDLAIRVEFFRRRGRPHPRIQPGHRVPNRTWSSMWPSSRPATTSSAPTKRLPPLRRSARSAMRRSSNSRRRASSLRLSASSSGRITTLRCCTEVGICKGIENYSAVLSGRAPGSMPTTLLDYFPEDFLLFVDESHVTLPQVRAMYGGDYARKKTLVEYGFRLPSAFDNRPLKFEEVESKLNQMIFVSATPGEYERQNSTQVAQQVIRPTGLLDPVISVRPVEGQVTDLLG